MAQTIDLQGLGPGFMHNCRARGYWSPFFLLADHIFWFFCSVRRIIEDALKLRNG